MNRKISIVFIALLAAMPAMVPMRVQALGGVPTLHVDPATNSADVGSTFNVFVMVSDVSDLVAYDVTLAYDTTALDIVTADFDGCLYISCMVFNGLPHFNIITSASDVTGTIRAALTLLGGASKTVVAPEPVIAVTFMVAAALDSPLDINSDQLVRKVGNGVQLVPHDTVDGQFLAPAKIELHRWNASVTPSQRHRALSRNETSVELVGTLRLSQKATRAGDAFIRFDITRPDAAVDTVDSNMATVNPGQIVDVTAVYSFPAQTGRYEIVATVVRVVGPVEVAGESSTGLHFFVDP